jgi:hypothetical protein
MEIKQNKKRKRGKRDWVKKRKKKGKGASE